MSFRPALLAAAFVALATPLHAEVPAVVTDILPVHSLVAMVMEGLGAPVFLVGPGSSPHDYAFRPHDAAALQASSLVIWVGPDLTGWLAEPLADIGGDARVLTLAEVPGATVLDFRQGAAFGDAEHDHEEEHGEEEHQEEHGTEAHDHHGTDAHMWLDPDNALVWVDAIAETLAGLDAANADAYRANAGAARAAIRAADAEVAAAIAPVRGRGFVVQHDAYQYFETHFAIAASGAVMAGHAESAGAARLSEIRDMIAADSIGCLLIEPQLSPALIEAVAQGADLRIGRIDPLGDALRPGPALYPALITGMGRAVAACLR